MRRTLVTLAVVSLFAACGFPSVSYTTGGDDGGADGSLDAPIGADGSDGDARADGTGDSSASDGEAGTGDDATSEAGDASGDTGDSSSTTDTGADGPGTDADAMTDASGDSGTGDASTDAIEDHVVDATPDAPDCDQDHDGYNSTSCSGGTDCCDTDPNAHPGVTAFFTAPDACGSYDYNCNNKYDAEYTVNVTCTGNSVTGCNGAAGFAGTPPACGASGTYQTACVLNGLLKCAASDDPTPPTQGCN